MHKLDNTHKINTELRWQQAVKRGQRERQSKSLTVDPLPQRVTQFQCAMLVFLMGITALIDGSTVLSVLYGGGSCILPQWYFARKSFQYRGATAYKQVLQSIYRGEVGKFLLSIACFTVVFANVPLLSPIAFFVAYICVQLMGAISPLLYTVWRAKNGVKP